MGKKRATEKKEKDFDVNEFLKENEIEVDPELLQMFNGKSCFMSPFVSQQIPFSFPD